MSQPYARIPVSSPKPRRKRRRTTLLPDSDDEGEDALSPQLPERSVKGEDEREGVEEGE
jgi:hypothetical protein